MPYLYSEDGRAKVCCDLTTKNEPGNLTLVKMNIVSVMELGGRGLTRSTKLIHHGIVRRWRCGSLVTQRPLSLLLYMTYQLLLSMT